MSYDSVDTRSDEMAAEETQRIAAVRRYDVLDTPPDGAFERITSLASTLFDVPISIVSIVDTDRIWFKSHHGIEATQIDREPGLCASAILHDGPWVIENAEMDTRALANPLVAGDFGLRFYAGVPLRTHDGYNLGTLCIIDQEPRELAAREVEILSDLASVVMDELELRRSARDAVAKENGVTPERRRTLAHTARVAHPAGAARRGRGGVRLALPRGVPRSRRWRFLRRDPHRRRLRGRGR